ncbi:MAG: oligosaccharide flippase family protein, partial [Pseudomonadota bacterium]
VSATSLSRVALGVLAGSSVWALMVSYVFGLATRIGILVKSVGDTLPRLRDAQRETLVTTAKAYRDFPLHNAPTGFLRDLSNTLPVFALTFVFTPAVAGFYSMANRLVWMPINTASTALRRVLTQRLAKYHKAGWGMMQPALLVTGGMAMVGAVPFGLLWLYAERVTPWLLGDQWVQAGQYVAVLTPLFFVGFLTRPTGTLYVVLRRQALGLRIQIGIVLARVSVFAHAFLNDLDVLSTLANFVYVSIAGNAVIFATGIWLAWRHDRQASGEPTAGLPD